LTDAVSGRSQGGHSFGKPGKVRELKSGQGKVRENELFSCCDYYSDKYATMEFVT